MEDLNTIVNLGFSRGDGVQAVAIALILSLIMKRYAEVWSYAAAAMAIDRTLIVLFMFLKGSGPGELVGYIWSGIQNAPENAGLLAVRLVGMMLIISIGFAARCKIHGKLAS
ncbi:MAG: hypothetical protein AAF527_10500 [Pseudomonadota bacterium]